MITVESAVDNAFKMADHIIGVIEANERRWQSMDGVRRRDLATLRALMNHAGVPHESLPEMPFLEPAHLEAAKARDAEFKARKTQEGEAA